MVNWITGGERFGYNHYFSPMADLVPILSLLVDSNLLHNWIWRLNSKKSSINNLLQRHNAVNDCSVCLLYQWSVVNNTVGTVRVVKQQKLALAQALSKANWFTWLPKVKNKQLYERGVLGLRINVNIGFYYKKYIIRSQRFILLLG